MKIISASRQTDIVAFYPQKVHSRLKNEKEPAFWVFWTKNPHNLLTMPLDFARSALQLTVTGLGGTELEKNVPAAAEVVATAEALVAKGFNPRLINWRYDPIIPGHSKMADVKWLAERFAAMGVTRCMTSFITWYGAVRERWPEGTATQVEPSKQRDIALRIHDTLQQHGIELFGCAQPHLAGVVTPARCIDGDHYATVTGFSFGTEKDAWQRKDCGCTVSTDIGSYEPCGHRCRYCYANPSPVDIEPDPQLELF